MRLDCSGRLYRDGHYPHLFVLILLLRAAGIVIRTGTRFASCQPALSSQNFELLQDLVRLCQALLQCGSRPETSLESDQKGARMFLMWGIRPRPRYARQPSLHMVQPAHICWCVAGARLCRQQLLGRGGRCYVGTGGALGSLLQQDLRLCGPKQGEKAVH